MRYLFVIPLAALAIFAWALQQHLVDIPPRWDPWAPLNIAAAPDWLTGFRLHRLSSDPALCKAVLGRSDMRYAELPDEKTGEDCGWHDAVRVSALPAALSSPFTLSCPSAVALVMWDEHVVQPAALKYFGKPVVRIDHFGSYACRNIRGSSEGNRRSQHATANAIDIAGFRLTDGRRIRVAADWSPKAPRAIGKRAARHTGKAESAAPDTTPESAFLHEVHHGACRFFTGTLGPEYNALHHDHFHLDRGPFHVCR